MCNVNNQRCIISSIAVVYSFVLSFLALFRCSLVQDSYGPFMVKEGDSCVSLHPTTEYKWVFRVSRLSGILAIILIGLAGIGIFMLNTLRQHNNNNTPSSSSYSSTNARKVYFWLIWIRILLPLAVIFQSLIFIALLACTEYNKEDTMNTAKVCLPGTSGYIAIGNCILLLANTAYHYKLPIPRITRVIKYRGGSIKDTLSQSHSSQVGSESEMADSIPDVEFGFPTTVKNNSTWNSSSDEEEEDVSTITNGTNNRQPKTTFVTTSEDGTKTIITEAKKRNGRKSVVKEIQEPMILVKYSSSSLSSSIEEEEEAEAEEAEEDDDDDEEEEEEETQHTTDSQHTCSAFEMLYSLPQLERKHIQKGAGYNHN